MAKKALVLITNSFPFGKGETFVDNEIRYYRDCRKKNKTL